MDWVTHIVSFIVGLGAGWTLRIAFISRKTSIELKSNDANYNVSQTKNNVTNGNIVGRDQNNSSR
ncbi:hypothetical protein [Providencia sp. PROV209]|uniref:hypothetical protein n=1 Tax=Providencia TaxID=586 RepID=UPI00234B460C|nr:hypothetical protein [Providencia sp. PROV209]